MMEKSGGPARRGKEERRAPRIDFWSGGRQKEAMMKWAGMAGGAVLFTSCATTVDLAKNEASTCEIHKVPMRVETVEASTGYAGYLPEYSKGTRESFPHHGGHHLLGGQYPMHVHIGKARAHVCPKCDAAYRDYVKRGRN